MIIRSLCRRTALAGPLATAPARCIAPQFLRQRRNYKIPSLTDHDRLVQEGIPDLLSPNAFKTAYTDYMDFLTTELNHLTAGTKHSNQEPKKLILEFSRDPQRAYEFNLASMAFNNHFFFETLNTKPGPPQTPSTKLLPKLNEHFSSMESLREEFLTTAEAMFGPGFVWLVQNNTTSQFRIMSTYIAGSPLSGAHYRRQPVDQNTQNEPTNSVGSFGAQSKVEKGQPKAPFGGVNITPLLCVNTWEHVWLQDYVPQYGFAGKRRYLEAWWDHINWVAVEGRAVFQKRDQQDSFRYEFI